MSCEFREAVGLTRIGNLDSDAASLEGLSIQSQSLFQALEVFKLGVRKSFRSALLAILNDSNIQNLAPIEELGDALRGCVI